MGRGVVVSETISTPLPAPLRGADLPHRGGGVQSAWYP